MIRSIISMTIILGTLFPFAALGQNAAVPDGKVEAANRELALNSTAVLKVTNPADARAALEEKIAGAGGFLTLITDDAIRAKVAPGKLSELLAAIGELGVVVDKSLIREDLTLEIAETEGALKSKMEILERLRGFLDDSDVNATLRIEQNMNSLVLEIEATKGRLRVLRDRSKWAVVDIYFQFRERDRIIYVSSPFDWLNSVNLNRFLEEF